MGDTVEMETKEMPMEEAATSTASWVRRHEPPTATFPIVTYGGNKGMQQRLPIASSPLSLAYLPHASHATQAAQFMLVPYGRQYFQGFNTLRRPFRESQNAYATQLHTVAAPHAGVTFQGFASTQNNLKDTAGFNDATWHRLPLSTQSAFMDSNNSYMGQHPATISNAYRENEFYSSAQHTAVNFNHFASYDPAHLYYVADNRHSYYGAPRMLNSNSAVYYDNPLAAATYIVPTRISAQRSETARVPASEIPPIPKSYNCHGAVVPYAEVERTAYSSAESKKGARKQRDNCGESFLQAVEDAYRSGTLARGKKPEGSMSEMEEHCDTENESAVVFAMNLERSKFVMEHEAALAFSLRNAEDFNSVSESGDVAPGKPDSTRTADHHREGGSTSTVASASIIMSTITSCDVNTAHCANLDEETQSDGSVEGPPDRSNTPDPMATRKLSLANHEQQVVANGGSDEPSIAPAHFLLQELLALSNGEHTDMMQTHMLPTAIGQNDTPKQKQQTNVIEKDISPPEKSSNLPLESIEPLLNDSVTIVELLSDSDEETSTVHPEENNLETKVIEHTANGMLDNLLTQDLHAMPTAEKILKDQTCMSPPQSFATASYPHSEATPPSNTDALVASPALQQVLTIQPVRAFPNDEHMPFHSHYPQPQSPTVQLQDYTTSTLRRTTSLTELDPISANSWSTEAEMMVDAPEAGTFDMIEHTVPPFCLFTDPLSLYGSILYKDEHWMTEFERQVHRSASWIPTQHFFFSWLFHAESSFMTFLKQFSNCSYLQSRATKCEKAEDKGEEDMLTILRKFKRHSNQKSEMTVKTLMVILDEYQMFELLNNEAEIDGVLEEFCKTIETINKEVNCPLITEVFIEKLEAAFSESAPLEKRNEVILIATGLMFCRIVEGVDIFEKLHAMLLEKHTNSQFSVKHRKDFVQNTCLLYCCLISCTRAIQSVLPAPAYSSLKAMMEQLWADCFFSVFGLCGRYLSKKLLDLFAYSFLTNYPWMERLQLYENTIVSYQNCFKLIEEDIQQSVKRWCDSLCDFENIDIGTSEKAEAQHFQGFLQCAKCYPLLASNHYLTKSINFKSFLFFFVEKMEALSPIFIDCIFFRLTEWLRGKECQRNRKSNFCTFVGYFCRRYSDYIDPTLRRCCDLLSEIVAGMSKSQKKKNLLSSQSDAAGRIEIVLDTLDALLWHCGGLYGQNWWNNWEQMALVNYVDALGARKTHHRIYFSEVAPLSPQSNIANDKARVRSCIEGEANDETTQIVTTATGKFLFNAILQALTELMKLSETEYMGMKQSDFSNTFTDRRGNSVFMRLKAMLLKLLSIVRSDNRRIPLSSEADYKRLASCMKSRKVPNSVVEEYGDVVKIGSSKLDCYALQWSILRGRLSDAPFDKFWLMVSKLLNAKSETTIMNEEQRGIYDEMASLFWLLELVDIQQPANSEDLIRDTKAQAEKLRIAGHSLKNVQTLSRLLEEEEVTGGIRIEKVKAMLLTFGKKLQGVSDLDAMLLHMGKCHLFQRVLNSPTDATYSAKFLFHILDARKHIKLFKALVTQALAKISIATWSEAVLLGIFIKEMIITACERIIKATTNSSKRIDDLVRPLFSPIVSYSEKVASNAEGSSTVTATENYLMALFIYESALKYHLSAAKVIEAALSRLGRHFTVDEKVVERVLESMSTAKTPPGVTTDEELGIEWLKERMKSTKETKNHDIHDEIKRIRRMAIGLQRRLKAISTNSQKKRGSSEMEYLHQEGSDPTISLEKKAKHAHGRNSGITERGRHRTSELHCTPQKIAEDIFLHPGGPRIGTVSLVASKRDVACLFDIYIRKRLEADNKEEAIIYVKCVLDKILSIFRNRKCGELVGSRKMELSLSSRRLFSSGWDAIENMTVLQAAEAGDLPLHLSIGTIEMPSIIFSELLRSLLEKKVYVTYITVNYTSEFDTRAIAAVRRWVESTPYPVKRLFIRTISFANVADWRTVFDTAHQVMTRHGGTYRMVEGDGSALLRSRKTKIGLCILLQQILSSQGVRLHERFDILRSYHSYLCIHSSPYGGRFGECEKFIERGSPACVHVWCYDESNSSRADFEKASCFE